MQSHKQTLSKDRKCMEKNMITHLAKYAAHNPKSPYEIKHYVPMRYIFYNQFSFLLLCLTASVLPADDCASKRALLSF